MAPQPKLRCGPYFQISSSKAGNLEDSIVLKTISFDFYCPSEKLIIELDGDIHFSEAGLEYDQKRDSELRELGFKIIRIENEDVFLATMAVLDKIKSCFDHP